MEKNIKIHSKILIKALLILSCIGLIPASNIAYYWLNNLFFTFVDYGHLIGVMSFILFLICPFIWIVYYASIMILEKSNSLKEEIVYKVIISFSTWIYGYLYFFLDIRPQDNHDSFLMLMIYASLFIPFVANSGNDYGRRQKEEYSNGKPYKNNVKDNIDQLYYQINQYGKDIEKLPKDFVLAWPESHFRKNPDEIRDILVFAALYCKKRNKYTPDLEAEFSNKYHSTKYIMSDDQAFKINELHRLLAEGNEVNESDRKMYIKHRDEVILSMFKSHQEFVERVTRES
jgi:hypothetical protein